MQETQVRFLGGEDPLEKEMATHSSILAWRISRPCRKRRPSSRHPWDFPGESTGVGCHCLLQGIFPTQESNPGLLHCRQTLYCLSHQGTPRCWCSRKPWVHSTCASDCRELLRVPLRSLGHCGLEGPLGTPVVLAHEATSRISS